MPPITPAKTMVCAGVSSPRGKGGAGACHLGVDFALDPGS